jgi:hypothetical protein
MVVLLLLPAVESDRYVGLFFLSGGFVVGFYKDGAAVVLVFWCFDGFWVFSVWWWCRYCCGFSGGDGSGFVLAVVTDLYSEWWWLCGFLFFSVSCCSGAVGGCYAAMLSVQLVMFRWC